jgi:preprotein translocase subunit SecY
MSFLRSHLVLMFIYALATATFFAFLWRTERNDRIRFFVIIFLSLFAGGIVISWLMYPFPLR